MSDMPVCIAVAGASGTVGRLLVAALGSRGVQVIALSRDAGVDLTTGAGVEERLAGAAAVVDVTNTASQDEREATAFFTAAATHLGRAASRLALRRLVVLSIIGVDRVPGGYYAAKFAQEQAARKAFGNVAVLRSAQFHEFAEQTLAWHRQGRRCLVADMTIQPVALASVVGALADLACAARAGPAASIAGPRREKLVDMVSSVAQRQGLEVEVIGQPVEAAIRGGALLPAATATLTGPTFRQWLNERYRPDSR